MHRRHILVALAIAVVAVAATPAFAGKGGGSGGRASASIAFADATRLASTGARPGDSLSFAVTANLRESDMANLWVGNTCSRNGELVYAEYHPVQSGTAGPFTLTGSTAGTSCRAWVWIFPELADSPRGGSMSYDVG